MRSLLRLAAVTAVFTVSFACTGETPSPEPAPAAAPAPSAPLAVPVEAPKDEPAEAPPAEPSTPGAAAGETWCCQYDGPLGKTQALIDNPGECASTYADHHPEFIAAPECAPVCCKYAKDPADLSAGFQWDTVAAGNCTMRKGTPVELDEGATCRDPDAPKPVARPRTKPAPEPEPEPTYRERLKNPLNPKGR